MKRQTLLRSLVAAGAVALLASGCWKVTFTGLSGEVTGAHIHGPALPGENAGVVIPFMTGMSGTITGQTNLTSAQALDLAAGRWYVNIHTAAFPGGEIRGQLTQRM
jgi:hypothetical protein